jgi:hypothetical protein
MSSLWTNLLFMHGHITNLELARRLADVPGPSGKPKGKRQRVAKVVASKAEQAPALVNQAGCVGR